MNATQINRMRQNISRSTSQEHIEFLRDLSHYFLNMPPDVEIATFLEAEKYLRSLDDQYKNNINFNKAIGNAIVLARAQASMLARRIIVGKDTDSDFFKEGYDLGKHLKLISNQIRSDKK